MNVKKRLLDGARMTRAIRRMAIEIVEKNRGIKDLLIVGIRSRKPAGSRQYYRETKLFVSTAVPVLAASSRINGRLKYLFEIRLRKAYEFLMAYRKGFSIRKPPNRCPCCKSSP